MSMKSGDMKNGGDLVRTGVATLIPHQFVWAVRLLVHKPKELENTLIETKCWHQQYLEFLTSFI